MTDILEEASELINGDRAQDYGDVGDNFLRIANLWSSYKNIDFNEHDVAMFMILVKVARQAGGYHRDSVVDIAGYAALAEKVAQYSAPVSQEFWDDIDRGIVEAQEKRERETTSKPPRVWESIADIPVGVHTFDVDGDSFWGDDEGPDEALDQYAPYTEVLS